jgi:hypothetical protein
MSTDDRLIPHEKLRYTHGLGFSKAKQVSLFIKGPIPMDWISAAAKLPGKAIHVALALYWMDGMNPQKRFKITRRALEQFKVSDDAYRDALLRMEAAKLIRVSRSPGQRALVEIVRDITQGKQPGP